MNKINPNHRKENSALKTFGPIILLIGIIFIAIGLISFFTAFGRFSEPKHFWCVFVGMPIFFVGAVMTKFAYLGKVARYTAGEIAPVAKDTFNYLATESSQGISAISKGLGKGASGAGMQGIEERIAKLKELKVKGVIDEEDFEEQKDRILSEL